MSSVLVLQIVLTLFGLVLLYQVWRIAKLRHAVETWQSLEQHRIKMRRATACKIGDLQAELLDAKMTTDGTADQLKTLELTTGGLWKSARGDIIRIRDLSDSHLSNILDGKFGGPRVRELIRHEIGRRAEDRKFAKIATTLRRQQEQAVKNGLRRLATMGAEEFLTSGRKAGGGVSERFDVEEGPPEGFADRVMEAIDRKRAARETVLGQMIADQRQYRRNPSERHGVPELRAAQDIADEYEGGPV